MWYCWKKVIQLRWKEKNRRLANITSKDSEEEGLLTMEDGSACWSRWFNFSHCVLSNHFQRIVGQVKKTTLKGNQCQNKIFCPKAFVQLDDERNALILRSLEWVLNFDCHIASNLGKKKIDDEEKVALQTYGTNGRNQTRSKMNKNKRTKYWNYRKKGHLREEWS